MGVVGIKQWCPLEKCLEKDPINAAITNYSSHPSIVNIKNHFSNSNAKFEFEFVSQDNIRGYIGKLDKRKKTSGNIPTWVFQSSVDICCPYIWHYVNECIKTGIFPDELKDAVVRPCYKKGDALNKCNYRPISLLSTISKVFERVLYDQIESFFADKFSPLLCGFRKGYSTQHALLNLLQKWQKCLDRGGVVGTILMDLSKAYDCLPHELIIAKLEAYGFGEMSLRLIYSYLSNRRMRVKVGNKLSYWLNILLGVPQGSILGPILFNIFLNEFFFCILETDICNFADDNTLYSCDTNLNESLMHLTRDAERAIEWFNINSLIANPEKFQMMFLGTNTEEEICLNISGTLIKSTKTVKLLGVTLDKDLSFAKHISNLCKMANSRTFALLRIRNYIDITKSRLIYNAHIRSCFQYCCLVWMFCSKGCDNKINQSHKRGLRAVYQVYHYSLEELLVLDGSASIHTSNLRSLMTEVYKSINHLNPQFMWNLFELKEVPYSLRGGNKLVLPPTKKITYGLYGLIFRASLIWNNLPSEIKESINLIDFKQKIRKWFPNICGCRLCR